MHDPEGKQELATIIFQCFQTLKLYGKEPEALEHITPMFQLVLADFSIAQVRQAFGFYLRHNTELPAPADIALIIERGGDKPPFERSVYVALQKKHPEDRSPDEWAYLREYEKFILTGKY